jgi:GNAT superfamily N-acetyltransferase
LSEPGGVLAAELAAVPAERVRPLRAELLRPGQAPERLRYPGDDAPDSLHLLASLDAGPVGIASVMRDPHPREPRAGDWRVRGMAVEPTLRGHGLGSRLLAACEQHARTEGASRLWCNARVPARGLYERAGFQREGEVFEIDDIGPHLVMAKTLD